jgi:hypothetical protein
VPIHSISQAVRIEADELIILPCPGGDRIIRRPVQFDRVYSNMTGFVSMKSFVVNFQLPFAYKIRQVVFTYLFSLLQDIFCHCGC